MSIVNQLNIVIYISLAVSLIASLLVISPNPKIKLGGVLCYFITNMALFVNYGILGAHSYLVTGIVFTSLNIINLIRTIKQIRRSSCQK